MATCHGGDPPLGWHLPGQGGSRETPLRPGEWFTVAVLSVRFFLSEDLFHLLSRRQVRRNFTAAGYGGMPLKYRHRLWPHLLGSISGRALEELLLVPLPPKVFA